MSGTAKIDTVRLRPLAGGVLLPVVIWLCMLSRASANDEDASAVVDRIQVNLARLKSVEFRFHVRNKTFIVPLGTGGYAEHEWDGHIILDSSGRFRQEYVEKGIPRSVVDAADRDGNRRLMSHHLETDSYSASIFRLTGGAMFADGPAVGIFLPQVWSRVSRANSGWKLGKSGDFVTLETQFQDSPNATHRYQVDPARSYLVTSLETVTKYNSAPTDKRRYDKYVSTTKLDYAEITPGFWFPIKGEYSQNLDGILTDERTLTINRDSIRFDRPIDASLFQITFPKGCRVVDQIGMHEYVVGGGTRGREAAESLVQQVNELTKLENPEHPVPAPGALSAVVSSSWDYVWPIVGLALAGCAIFEIMRRRRR